MCQAHLYLCDAEYNLDLDCSVIICPPYHFQQFCSPVSTVHQDAQQVNSRWHQPDTQPEGLVAWQGMQLNRT